MEQTDLGSIIQKSISRFSHNRLGDKPPVFVVISPALSSVPWKDQTLKEFVHCFLYESLLTSDPDAAIEVSLHKRLGMTDLNAFLGIQSHYWIQLRVAGRGLKVVEPTIEDLFDEVGYRCEEWVGVETGNARLGIFSAADAPSLKMIFCLESSRNVLKCDLLLPIAEHSAAPDAVGQTAGT